MKTIITIKLIALVLLGFTGLASAQNLRVTKPVGGSPPGADMLEENVTKAVDGDANHRSLVGTWVISFYDAWLRGYNGKTVSGATADPLKPGDLSFYYWVNIKYCRDKIDTAWGKKNCNRKWLKYDLDKWAHLWGG